MGVDAKFRCGSPPSEHPKQGANGGQSPMGVTHTTSIFLGDTADVIPVGAASSLSSLPSFVDSKSRKKSSRAKKSPWSAPTLIEVYPSQKAIGHLKSIYKHQAEQAGQPDDVWIPPPSPGQRILNETLQQRTVGGPSEDAWQKCYELARAIEGEVGATLVDLARQNGADLDDVLAGIEVSHKTGKPLDYELASFLD
jgi:hypothetical protein